VKREKTKQNNNNTCERATIGFVFTSDWPRRWSEIFDQLLSVVMRITFGTRMKIALLYQSQIIKKGIHYCVLHDVGRELSVKPADWV